MKGAVKDGKFQDGTCSAIKDSEFSDCYWKFQDGTCSAIKGSEFPRRGGKWSLFSQENQYWIRLTR